MFNAKEYLEDKVREANFKRGGAPLDVQPPMEVLGFVDTVRSPFVRDLLLRYVYSPVFLNQIGPITEFKDEKDFSNDDKFNAVMKLIRDSLGYFSVTDQKWGNVAYTNPIETGGIYQVLAHDVLDYTPAIKPAVLEFRNSGQVTTLKAAYVFKSAPKDIIAKRGFTYFSKHGFIQELYGYGDQIWQEYLGEMLASHHSILSPTLAYDPEKFQVFYCLPLNAYDRSLKELETEHVKIKALSYHFMVIIELAKALAKPSGDLRMFRKS